MNGAKINKRKKRNIKPPSKVQGNNGWAEIRKVGSGVNVSIKGGDASGRESLVYLTDLQARQTNSMANTKVDYTEPRGLEDQRNANELYSIRCHDCD